MLRCIPEHQLLCAWMCVRPSFTVALQCRHKPLSSGGSPLQTAVMECMAQTHERETKKLRASSQTMWTWSIDSSYNYSYTTPSVYTKTQCCCRADPVVQSLHRTVNMLQQLGAMCDRISAAFMWRAQLVSYRFQAGREMSPHGSHMISNT